MKGKGVFVPTVFILLFSLLLTSGLNHIKVSVEASTSYPVHNINTGLNYTTIQAAINANETLDGHTIFVEEGRYYENIVVNKTLSLLGEDPYFVIIDGGVNGWRGAIKNMLLNIARPRVQEHKWWRKRRFKLLPTFMLMQESNIYLKYEIPLDMRASVFPIENLEEESTKNATEDPAELKELIHGYDAAVSIGLTKDYIEKRGFEAFKSLREIVQNTLDEVELITGKPDVNIEKDSFGTWIIDKGRGLGVDALSIGSTNKECWMRGYYGEGLKLAAAYFTLRNIPVYIFTKNNVFKFVATPRESENPRIFAVLGKSKIEVEGTKVLLFGFNIRNGTLNKMVSFHNKNLADKKIAEAYSSSPSCPYKKASAIYDYPNLLYIRNMFVGNMDQVTKRKSLFSYDLWWFRLDVSRTLVTYSMPKLFEEASKVFEASKEAETKLAEKLLETKMLTTRKIANGLAIEFKPIFSIFEGHLFVYAFPKGMLDTMLEVLHLQDKKHLLARTTGEENLEAAVKKGIIPFIVSEELSEEFKRIRPLSELSK